MTNPHLKTGVDSTPETCEKHFRQWIPSNKFMLQNYLKSCHILEFNFVTVFRYKGRVLSFFQIH